MKTITIKVDGMHCMKCSAKVENALSEVVGVIEAQVSLDEKKVNITCLDSTDEQNLKNAITDVGFIVM